jgi:DegV family protein with EDD domain
MITIVADTLSCLTVDEAKVLGIPYIPQVIIIGDTSYKDDTEIDSKTFLEKLKTSPVLPKTAAPPPFLYNPVFEKYAAPGNTVIVISPPEGLSGTYRSATVASQDFPNADIRVIDTNIIASGLGNVVRQAKLWVDQGKTADEIITGIIEMSSRWRVYFVVDTLEYLHKGGRIGTAKALLGSLLQVKPILSLRDGAIFAAESQRTKKKAITRLQELVYKDCPKTLEGHLSIMHAGVELEAQALAEEMSQTLGINNIWVTEVPPAIVVHAGPGTIAAGFFIAS